MLHQACLDDQRRNRLGGGQGEKRTQAHTVADLFKGRGRLSVLLHKAMDKVVNIPPL